MKRNPKPTKTNVDIFKPIDVDVSTHDCFGNWSATAKECTRCADSDVCGILTAKKLKAKAEKVEPQPLDLVDFSFLYEGSIDFIETGKTTAKELVATVAKKAKCKEPKTVLQQIKNWLPNSEYIVKNGVVCKR